MTVRPATDADVPFIVEMGLQFIGSTVYRSFLTPSVRHIEDLVTRLIADDRGVVFVLEMRGGDVVGMLGAMLAEHFITGLPTATELFWWADPSARGHGIRLLRAFEQWARSRGATVAQMVAPTADVAAIYERVGYVEMERAYQRSL